MVELERILREATAGIDGQYFRLPIDGGSPEFKERVYCYELYHQMRTRWPRGSPFVLNAEVDKRAHPLLRKKKASRCIPDLLVHGPGDMTRNYAVIEVKPMPVRREGICKDIRTLALFRSEVGYKRALYLLYGDRDQATLNRVRDVINECRNLPEIEIWVHAEPGTPAVMEASTANWHQR